MCALLGGWCDKNRKFAKTKMAVLGWRTYGWFSSQCFLNTDLLAVVRQQIQFKKKKSPFWHPSSLPITIRLLDLFFPITIQHYWPHVTLIITVPMIH